MTHYCWVQSTQLLYISFIATTTLYINISKRLHLCHFDQFCISPITSFIATTNTIHQYFHKATSLSFCTILGSKPFLLFFFIFESQSGFELPSFAPDTTLLITEPLSPEQLTGTNLMDIYSYYFE